MDHLSRQMAFREQAKRWGRKTSSGSIDLVCEVFTILPVLSCYSLGVQQRLEEKDQNKKAANFEQRGRIMLPVYFDTFFNQEFQTWLIIPNLTTCLCQKKFHQIFSRNLAHTRHNVYHGKYFFPANSCAKMNEVKFLMMIYFTDRNSYDEHIQTVCTNAINNLFSLTNGQSAESRLNDNTPWCEGTLLETATSQQQLINSRHLAQYINVIQVKPSKLIALES